jgi:23S rRNA (cytidine1920-2'-O)/16S rRNA (cytidine1409-2'-O)-methyltransferase
VSRKRAKKVRLDDLLVERGLVEDLKSARAWIMSGNVIVDEVRDDKPGTPVMADASIRIRGKGIPFASRGGLKLSAALDAFGVDVEGRIVLDAGASTGGFTDCLLSRGAAYVYAVDVGFGQLTGKLRQHPRVANMEKTNIGDIVPGELDPAPNMGVIDLSYLSLSIAVPTVARLLMKSEFGVEPEIIALVKPLFEVAAAGPDLGYDQFMAAVERGVSAGETVGYFVHDIMASPVLGSGGTLEFLIHYRNVPTRLDLGEKIDAAVCSGMQLVEYSGGPRDWAREIEESDSGDE